MPKIVLLTVTQLRIIKGYGLRSSMLESLATTDPFLDITVQEDMIANGPVVLQDVERKKVESYIRKEGPKGNFIRIADWAQVNSTFILYCPDDFDVVYDNDHSMLCINGANIGSVLNCPEFKTIAKNHIASLQRCGLTKHDARTLRALYSGSEALLCQYGSSSLKNDTDENSIVRISKDGQITYGNPKRYLRGLIMAADHTFKPTVNEESDFDRDEIIEELADAGHKRARLKKMDDAELVKLHEREFSEEEDDEEPRVSTVNTEISVLEVESSLELLTEELRLVLASAGVDRKHLLQADLKSLIASSIKLIDENLLDD